jgi:hypothetical protein
MFDVGFIKRMQVKSLLRLMTGSVNQATITLRPKYHDL